MDFVIDEKYAGAAVRDFLKTGLGLSSRTLAKLKNDGEGIVLNGERVTVRATLAAGDLLSLAVEDRPDDENPDVIPEDIDVDILYEDGNVIAADKPSGMATHPSYNHRSGTLANALAGYFAKKGTPFVFRAINRLDLEASGAVLVAKSKTAAYKYNAAMIRGEIEKEYLALLKGTPDPPEGRIESYISRLREGVVIRCSKPTGMPSEYALTEYSTLDSANGHTLVRAVPVTGRTHQLRVHFSSVGAPILGDGMYGGGSGLISRTALHSRRLTFTRLSDGAFITVNSGIPRDINNAWERIKCQNSENR